MATGRDWDQIEEYLVSGKPISFARLMYEAYETSRLGKGIDGWWPLAVIDQIRLEECLVSG